MTRPPRRIGAPPSPRSSYACSEAYCARSDVGAVIHTHSVYTTAPAVAGQEIPPVIDQQVAVWGEAVRVAEYGMSATEALAVVAVVERVAKVHVTARLLGEVRPLPDHVVEIEERLFRRADE